MAFSVPNLIFCILLLLSHLTIAQTNKNINLGSSLTATDDNSSWPSPSGDFAFGFQRIGTGGFLLAIWFNKVPEKTIIWSANRNNLAQEGSKIQLTKDGRFVLSDPKGNETWSANLGKTRASNGAILDSGNFVLSSSDSVTLWQSFDEPTDTILPTQRLNLGSRLIASFSKTDYSNGRFGFMLQTDGDLMLYTTNFPLDSNNSAYWSTRTRGSGFQVVFNQSGYIYLASRDGKILELISSIASSTDQFYQRAVLEFDGVFRHYVYPKSAGSNGERPMEWSILSFIPSDICTSIVQDTGSGACGFNSYCILGNDQRPKCECPSGYTFIDTNDPLSSCQPNFAPQSCDKGSQETNLFGFMDMPNTDWPLSDYEYYQPVTEGFCRNACLGDCFCAVAIFRDDNCWKKKNPLSNGRIDPSVGGKALIKVRKDNSTT
ncbi:G-type lectin S-receptor-like serine/threonine-protein kinase LECRK3 [Cornus florida]|uniref:G-type lectin S-receptor-like serine/threonine-protein kinase LECRK3 n=1 Tax=Cornus florida TaxID=4283 RepID=UPI0028986A1A|nr:G-type lectin S-receptor-like serine/threonine-protein kinase LECRK3 [Cornus florida]